MDSKTASLRGKRAIVTGGAVRVGRAISLALARAGCDLLLHYGRSAPAAEETAREAESLGVRVALQQANLAHLDQASSIIPAAERELGGVDILVNSAAIFPAGGLLETDDEAWQKVFDINLRAPFVLSRDFARHRLEKEAREREARRGAKSDAGREDLHEGTACIVNILDARTRRPAPDHFAYRLTKSALHAMTEGLALELAPRVRVNAVALGAILPAPGDSVEEFEELVKNRVPLQRPGSAEIVAENVLHLLHQPFLTGATIRLDGGEFL